MNKKAVLYIFSGLPGAGKSTLAQYLANKLNAVYLRIDTIEWGLIDLCKFNVPGEGYRLAYRIAEDNLKIGNNVISDQCNPFNFIRDEWNNVAIKNNCAYINIEIICSDKIEHKRRIENRNAENKNVIITWEEVQKRETDVHNPIYYEPWEEEHLILDTANKSIEECGKELFEKLMEKK
jgi:predicted kinase